MGGKPTKTGKKWTQKRRKMVKNRNVVEKRTKYGQNVENLEKPPLTEVPQLRIRIFMAGSSPDPVVERLTENPEFQAKLHI